MLIRRSMKNKRLILLLLILIIVSNQITFANTEVTPKITHTNTIKNTSYIDREWEKKDTEKFKLIWEKAKNKQVKLVDIFDEYQALNQKYYELDKTAYRGERGYTLYSPDLLYKLDILNRALEARNQLLLDIADEKKISDFEDYYSSVIYEGIGFSGDTIKEKDFIGYNQDEIIQFLDNIPINDYFLYGLKFYFMDGNTKYGANGVNHSNSRRGFYDDSIVIYSNSDHEYVLEVLTHEIGHSVSREVLYKYNNDDFMEWIFNAPVIEQYTAMYDENVIEADNGRYYSEGHEREWAYSLDENFAEDFKRTIMGVDKLSGWSESDSEEVRSLIEKTLKNIDFKSLMTFKDVVVKSGSMPCHFKTNETIFVSNDSLTISLPGLKGESVGIIVSGGSYYKIFEMGNKDTLSFKLPKEGSYDIKVATLNKNKKPYRLYPVIFDLEYKKIKGVQ